MASAIVLALASTVWASPLATLTTLRQIHALGNGDGNKGFPVSFEATVTYVRGYERMLFVQDEDLAIFVLLPDPVDGAQLKLNAGDRILIKGVTTGSFNPIVVGHDISILLRPGPSPASVPATYEQLVKGQFDCRLVTVRGVVRAADLDAKATSMNSGLLELLTESGHIGVHLDTTDPNVFRTLLDTTVEVTGVSAGKFDDKMELTGTEVYVPMLSNIHILAPARSNPWSLPVTPMDKILSVYNLHDLTPRIRVQGTVTYYHPGFAVVIQDDFRSLWIETRTREPLRIGDRAEAIGFTDAHDRLLTLVDAEIQDSGVFAPVVPRPSTWEELAAWSMSTPNGHQNDLVSIEGTVTTAVREVAQDEFVLISDGRLFTAIYRHPQALQDTPPMMEIAPGTKIRVTGICTRTDTRTAAPGTEVPFNILLRSFNDIAVVKNPSLMNIRNLTIAVGLLLIAVAIAGTRGWVLERKVRQKTAALAARIETESALQRRLAQIEQQRSRILEDINGSRPVTEILDQIAKMVSAMLDGAPSWCEAPDGSRHGVSPPDPQRLRIVCVPIDGHSVALLGAFFAAFNPATPPDPEETKALEHGARLATLAIETRRLYSDLCRRSEYDLLTEVPNRFSMYKRLDALIEEGQRNASRFGLIYIDLDKFKPINDTYGHHIGDVYLQQVSTRMAHQLLGGDMLARLGGDEFAALVSLQHGQADLDRVVARLESCFDAPFNLEGTLLQGEASFGPSIYPKDGTTKESLLAAADAAMYAAKNRKKQMSQDAAVAQQVPRGTEKPS